MLNASGGRFLPDWQRWKKLNRDPGLDGDARDDSDTTGLLTRHPAVPRGGPRACSVPVAWGLAQVPMMRGLEDWLLDGSFVLRGSGRRPLRSCSSTWMMRRWTS